MSSSTMYKKGVKVWIPHPEKVWQSANIVADYEENQNKLYVQADDTAETHILDIRSSAHLPPLCLPKDISLDVTSNLNSLSVIHEATILHKLQSRFELGHTYSYCGISTVALNPHFQFPENEGHQISNYQKPILRNLVPHVFGVAEKVFRKMKRENCDQTIIFTGESGSGKSVNAERAILYLTTTNSKQVAVKEKILASSVILQAFGNASTAINDDSSRFGKFVQIQYGVNYQVIGALLSTYNLDRSNVFSQGQRNAFNIFYYMYAVKDELPHLQLDKCQFNYAKEETDIGAYSVKNGNHFDKMMVAFEVLGFSEEEKKEVQEIVAVLLHLNSLSFRRVEERKTNEDAESCFIEDQNCLKTFGKILGLRKKALAILEKWMCHNRKGDQDEISKPMSVDQAMKARDALAKLIYTKLFNWLVRRINVSFGSICRSQKFIGIMDMHGFEKLDFNSFEQFCINYLDEKFEQLFIESTFKLEQQEFEKDQIDWEPIDFSDNLSSLDLIGDKCGILHLVDRETKTSSGDVLAWLQKLYSTFETFEKFEKTTETASDFTIHHFIYPVKYNAVDFLAKNYESVAKEQLEVLKDTKNVLLNKLITDEIPEKNTPKAKKRRLEPNGRFLFYSKLSGEMVTTELRAFLNILSSILNKTSKSFVRCIKSNDEKKPLMFNSQRVAQQLRAYNIVQTVEMSKEGYFYNLRYKEFAKRYNCLYQSGDLKYENDKMVCLLILTKYGMDDDVKLGMTKVFLSEYTVDRLEEERDRKILVTEAAKKIELFYRACLYFGWFHSTIRVTRTDAQELIMLMDRQHVANTPVADIHKQLMWMLACGSYEMARKNIKLIQSYMKRFLDGILKEKLKARKDLRKKALHQGITNNLSVMWDRIDDLASLYMTKKSLESAKCFLDKQTSVHFTNKLLNELLLIIMQDICKNQRPMAQIKDSEPNTGCDISEQATSLFTHDTPIPELYVDEKLYQKLFDSFQILHGDVEALHRTAGIGDAEILKWMESYRISSQAAKKAGDQALEKLIQIRKKH